MMRRIVTTNAGGIGDAGPESATIKLLTEEVRQVLSEHGDEAFPEAMALLRDASSELIAESPPFSEAEHAQIQNYVDGLDEEARSIFFRRRQGESRREIAAAMGVSEKSVARTLARIHSQMFLQIRS